MEEPSLSTPHKLHCFFAMHQIEHSRTDDHEGLVLHHYSGFKYHRLLKKRDAPKQYRYAPLILLTPSTNMVLNHIQT